MEKVKVIEWTSNDPSNVYRLDSSEDGERFFQDLLINAETDGRETFKVGEMTQQEWDQCVANGKEDC